MAKIAKINRIKWVPSMNDISLVQNFGEVLNLEIKFVYAKWYYVNGVPNSKCSDNSKSTWNTKLVDDCEHEDRVINKKDCTCHVFM